MKFLLIFVVSTLVVVSQQERKKELVWWSPSSSKSPIDNYQRSLIYYDPVESHLPYFRFSRPIRPTVVYSQNNEEESNGELLDSRNGFADVQSNEDNRQLGRIVVVHHYLPKPEATDIQPRIKNNYDSQFQDSGIKDVQQQENRFYVNSDSTYNPFLRTVTLRVTSTCTSLSIVSCIPAASLPAAPVPACRRKRNSVIDPDEDGGQFPIHPTQVQTVTPTEQPWPALPSAEMSSSIEEEDDELNSVGIQLKKQARKGRFLHWKNYFTSTTSTSWAVVSSTLTQTFVPAVALACLPPGFLVC